MSFGDDTLDPSNREEFLIQELIDAVGKLLLEKGEAFRLQHAELADAFQAVSNYRRS